ncbi:sortase (surface protein transpeptidase) [Microbacterium sp. SLBN-154]|uniref:class F sortase n=1 Tax=Microbacterium sp. SLBN-154 TaxID=2768458 RepID=UPI001166675C|nr:class F sortase [Microbacterium sp. SLBN-154]TQK19983.1 sortase (surface protein transpeptidase) [Microbacterium sp. SLBN-154]
MIRPRSAAQRPFWGEWALRGALAAVLVLAIGSAAACATQRSADSPPPASPAVSQAAPTPSSEPEAQALPPARVSVPSISLDEPLIDLGLNTDGSMQVPTDFDEVGWFTGGGRPGGTGPVVIAGHVDSPTGPAVFVRLRDVQVGDLVEVVDTAGTAHAYVVTETMDYPKSAFPTAAVFGAVVTDELRLITCGGVFDQNAGSYVDNRVVYARRVVP